MVGLKCGDTVIVVISMTAWQGTERVCRHGMGVLSMADSSAHEYHLRFYLIDNNKYNHIYELFGISTGEASKIHSGYGHGVDSHDH